jgi:LuxR family maltose regulon positive regulatory protein
MANAIVLAEHVELDVASLYRPPAFGGGLVSRPRLVERLLDPSQPPLAAMTAPAGYGKTTLLAEWAERDTREVSWIALDRAHDDDPSLLAAAVATALNRPGPFALVLDDVQVLRSLGARNVLSALVDQVPPGSRLVLSSRTTPPLPIGRLRAQRSLVELGPRDLAMTVAEATGLLAAEGVRPPGDAVEGLVAATDGWPAPLYLAALSLREHGHQPGEKQFTARDSAVRQYVNDAVLSDLSAEAADLLARTSILDKLSGSLCDAVLRCERSGRLLDELGTHRLLLVPLDRAGDWYRCPAMLRETLARDLQRDDPTAALELRRRAAEWYEAHDDGERAIDQAVASGDVVRAGELLWQHAPSFVAKGRRSTVRRWLAGFADRQIAADPRLALVSACSAFADGDLDGVERWQASAHGRLRDVRPREATGETAAVANAMRAVAACAGLETLAEEAASARRQMPGDSPWGSLCYFMEGAALHLVGEPERAEALLEEGARRGAVIAPGPHTLCLAQLALMAGDRGDWEGAAALAARARVQVEHYGLDDYPTSALVFAASAAARARCGRVDESQDDVRHALRLLDELAGFIPWFVAEVRVALAIAVLRLGDVSLARELIADARRNARRVRESDLLANRIREAEASAAAAAAAAIPARASLTAAELRVLRFLPTHLSFREIAGRLYVSANTVKTQAHAVYGKLDASSRSQAVARAAELGLLDM